MLWLILFHDLIEILVLIPIVKLVMYLVESFYSALGLPVK